jgi:deazaflavin-dependent oxidoreductase (nitroreductase family)
MKADTQPKPIDPRYNGLIRFFMKIYTRVNVAVYRASGGRLMNRFPNGSPICLVTMTGRRSGRRRTIPLIHVPHGEDVILIASQGGMSSHPLWFWNISANPEVSVTADGVTRRMRARRVDDAEKAALWPVALAVYPDFDEYQARTERNIPVFVCSPV